MLHNIRPLKALFQAKIRKNTEFLKIPPPLFTPLVLIRTKNLMLNAKFLPSKFNKTSFGLYNYFVIQTTQPIWKKLTKIELIKK